jgi:transposase-like protein
MQRQKFSREFKVEAVKLVGERGVSVRKPGLTWGFTSAAQVGEGARHRARASLPRPKVRHPFFRGLREDL